MGLYNASNVGSLNWSFGPEYDAMNTATRGRVYGAYSQAAEQMARAGGASGVARAALTRAQGATAGEQAAQGLLSQTQQNDLQAQQIGSNADIGLKQALAAGTSARASMLNAQTAKDQLALDRELGLGQLDISRMNAETNARSVSDQYDLGLRSSDYQNSALAEQARQYDQGRLDSRSMGLASILGDLGINPADYMDVLDQLAAGDYSGIDTAGQVGTGDNTDTSTGSGGSTSLADILQSIIGTGSGAPVYGYGTPDSGYSNGGGLNPITWRTR